MPCVFLVTDNVSAGNPDLYGVFSTRERAQAWIDRQKARKYPWCDGLVISECELDVAVDLAAGTRH